MAGGKQKAKKVKRKKAIVEELGRSQVATAPIIPPPAPHSTINYDKFKNIGDPDSDGDKDSPLKRDHDRWNSWREPRCTCCDHEGGHSGDTSEDDEDEHDHLAPAGSDGDEENLKVYDDYSGEYIPRVQRSKAAAPLPIAQPKKERPLARGFFGSAPSKPKGSVSAAAAVQANTPKPFTTRDLCDRSMVANLKILWRKGLDEMVSYMQNAGASKDQMVAAFTHRAKELLRITFEKDIHPPAEMVEALFRANMLNAWDEVFHITMENFRRQHSVHGQAKGAVKAGNFGPLVPIAGVFEPRAPDAGDPEPRTLTREKLEEMTAFREDQLDAAGCIQIGTMDDWPGRGHSGKAKKSSSSEYCPVSKAEKEVADLMGFVPYDSTHAAQSGIWKDPSFLNTPEEEASWLANMQAQALKESSKSVASGSTGATADTKSGKKAGKAAAKGSTSTGPAKPKINAEVPEKQTLEWVGIPIDEVMLDPKASCHPESLPQKVLALLREAAREDGFGFGEGAPPHDTLIYMLNGDHLTHDKPELKVKYMLGPLDPPLPSQTKEYWNTVLFIPVEAWPPKPMDPRGKTKIVWTNGGIYAEEIEHALAGEERCNLVGFPVDDATANALGGPDKAVWASIREKMWTACNAACYDWFGVGAGFNDTNVYLMPPDEGTLVDAARKAAGYCVVNVDIVNYCQPAAAGWGGHTRFYPCRDWPPSPLRPGGRVRIIWGTLRTTAAKEITGQFQTRRKEWMPWEKPLNDRDRRLVAFPLDFACIKRIDRDGPHKMHQFLADHLAHVRRCAEEDGFGTHREGKHDTLVYMGLDDRLPKRPPGSRAFLEERVVAYGVATLQTGLVKRDAPTLEFPQRFPPQLMQPPGKTIAMRQNSNFRHRKSSDQGESAAKKGDAKKGPKKKETATGPKNEESGSRFVFPSTGLGEPEASQSKGKGFDSSGPVLAATATSNSKGDGSYGEMAGDDCSDGPPPLTSSSSDDEMVVTRNSFWKREPDGTASCVFDTGPSEEEDLRSASVKAHAHEIENSSKKVKAYFEALDADEIKPALQHLEAIIAAEVTDGDLSPEAKDLAKMVGFQLMHDVANGSNTLDSHAVAAAVGASRANAKSDSTTAKGTAKAKGKGRAAGSPSASRPAKVETDELPGLATGSDDRASISADVSSAVLDEARRAELTRIVKEKAAEKAMYLDLAAKVEATRELVDDVAEELTVAAKELAKKKKKIRQKLKKQEQKKAKEHLAEPDSNAVDGQDAAKSSSAAPEPNTSARESIYGKDVFTDPETKNPIRTSSPLQSASPPATRTAASVPAAAQEAVTAEIATSGPEAELEKAALAQAKLTEAATQKAGPSKAAPVKAQHAQAEPAKSVAPKAGPTKAEPATAAAPKAGPSTAEPATAAPTAGARQADLVRRARSSRAAVIKEVDSDGSSESLQEDTAPQSEAHTGNPFELLELLARAQTSGLDSPQPRPQRTHARTPSPGAATQRPGAASAAPAAAPPALVFGAQPFVPTPRPGYVDPPLTKAADKLWHELEESLVRNDTPLLQRANDNGSSWIIRFGSNARFAQYNSEVREKVKQAQLRLRTLESSQTGPSRPAPAAVAPPPGRPRPLVGSQKLQLPHLQPQPLPPAAQAQQAAFTRARPRPAGYAPPPAAFGQPIPGMPGLPCIPLGPRGYPHPVYTGSYIAAPYIGLMPPPPALMMMMAPPPPPPARSQTPPLPTITPTCNPLASPAPALYDAFGGVPMRTGGAPRPFVPPPPRGPPPARPPAPALRPLPAQGAVARAHVSQPMAPAMPLPKGFDTAAASTTPAGQDDAELAHECVVCMDWPIEVVLIPCGHAEMCSKCAHDIFSRKKECPTCRKCIDFVDPIPT